MEWFFVTFSDLKINHAIFLDSLLWLSYIIGVKKLSFIWVFLDIWIFNVYSQFVIYFKTPTKILARDDTFMSLPPLKSEQEKY